jgi:hypothetical protein
MAGAPLAEYRIRDDRLQNPDDHMLDEYVDRRGGEIGDGEARAASIGRRADQRERTLRAPSSSGGPAYALHPFATQEFR